MNIIQVPAAPSNYTVGRQGEKVRLIVNHWMAGYLSGTDKVFQNPSRGASTHYGVGPGEVHQYVSEENTAWGANNWAVNLQAINIEHEGGPNIPIQVATYVQSVELQADICARYGIDPYGTVTVMGWSDSLGKMVPRSVPTILAHHDADSLNPPKYRSRTSCPGTLDLGVIRERIAARLSTPPPTVPVISRPTRYLFSKNLSFGMRGEEVKQLQLRLKAEGTFTADATGYYGDITAGAVLEYQKRVGIINHNAIWSKSKAGAYNGAAGYYGAGFCGPATRSKLNA